ncbi:MAG: 6-phosphofructokinase [Candidatus Margulisiibacteriota bacterium]
MKRILILTGGGDCPGLNAVIRAIVRAALNEGGWEVLGSKRAFNGLLQDPQQVVVLDKAAVSGIHVKGGTILETTNKGNPFSFPTPQADGSTTLIDRSDELIETLKRLNVEAVINIGGNGSQQISQKLFEKGLHIIGVPKTIDNDLAGTDVSFGFETAVQIATEAVDKLVSTAESHNRVMIAEVMGRDAGWICLHAAIAAGADVAIIPEIPYRIDSVIEKLNNRFHRKLGFANIVIAEGAKPLHGKTVQHASTEAGYQNAMLGGVGYQFMAELTQKMDVDARVTVLGHTQRGGIPCAYDRILATQFGIRAFEAVLNQEYGKMVALKGAGLDMVPLQVAASSDRLIPLDHPLIDTAKRLGICLGD